MPYERGGREAQKARTREVLVAAAQGLVTEGATPTVPAAAARAGVSRTSAYRYFPTQRDLLVAAHPETGAVSMLADSPPDDPTARLEMCLRRFLGMVLDTEPQQRTMLRLSLAEDPRARGGLPLRQGRAIGWLTEALEPVRSELGDAGLRRLILTIRSAAGIEALVWLVDVGGLSRDEAVTAMCWSAQAMLSSARAEARAKARARQPHG
jgi:AcrR family transcriptional regulator